MRFNKFKTWRARRAFNKVRGEIYENIANSMIKDGVPLKNCLSKLVARASKDRDPAAPLYAAWLRRMGDSAMRGEFTACIKTDIPNSDYMVMSGFEHSGRLAEGILYQSQLIGKMQRMKSEFIMTLVKPGIAIIAAIALSAFFSTVAENFLEVAPMEKWSAFSQMMFKYTLFVNSNLMLIFGGLVLGGGWLSWSMTNWGRRNVRLRHRLDQYLPYVLYRDFTAFSVLIVIASLMSSGMPLKVATQNIMNTGSIWIKSYFRKIIRRLGDASIKSPAEAFDVGFFPKRIFYRLLDASEQGDFHVAIRRIAEDSFDAMERDMKKRAFVLDQLSYLIAGGVIGLIAAGLAFAIGDIRVLAKG